MTARGAVASAPEYIDEHARADPHGGTLTGPYAAQAPRAGPRPIRLAAAGANQGRSGHLLARALGGNILIQRSNRRRVDNGDPLADDDCYPPPASTPAPLS